MHHGNFANNRLILQQRLDFGAVTHESLNFDGFLELVVDINFPVFIIVTKISAA